MEKQTKEQELEKDYLTKHFSIECNKCKNRKTVLVSIFEDDYADEINVACMKCGFKFTIKLEGYDKGIKEGKAMVTQADIDNFNKLIRDDVFNKGIQEGRTQAISEFAEKLKEKIIKSPNIVLDEELIGIIDKTAQEITK